MPSPFQPGQNETVDAVGGPALVRDFRERRPFRANVGPVPAPGSPLANPAGQQVDLPARQFLARIDRRHPESFLLGGDSPDELALFRVSGDDGPMARVQPPQGGILEVEAQSGHALVLIGPVAGVAVVGEDGTNVAVEVERRAFLGSGRLQGVGDKCRHEANEYPGGAPEKQPASGSQAAHGWLVPPHYGAGGSQLHGAVADRRGCRGFRSKGQDGTRSVWTRSL